MHDLPNGPALLALARDVLLQRLMPLLPQEAHLDVRLVANAMAVAEREALSGEQAARDIRADLERLYGDRPYANPLPQLRGEGDPLDGPAGTEPADLLARFADDLRRGGFETSESRERCARDILWRLTIAKLRLANPRFLNANGFS